MNYQISINNVTPKLLCLVSKLTSYTVEMKSSNKRLGDESPITSQLLTKTDGFGCSVRFLAEDRRVAV